MAKNVHRLGSVVVAVGQYMRERGCPRERDLLHAQRRRKWHMKLPVKPKCARFSQRIGKVRRVAIVDFKQFVHAPVTRVWSRQSRDNKRHRFKSRPTRLDLADAISPSPHGTYDVRHRQMQAASLANADRERAMKLLMRQASTSLEHLPVSPSVVSQKDLQGIARVWSVMRVHA